MKKIRILSGVAGLLACGISAANAQVIIGGDLNNGNLDTTYMQEIVPGFSLPKPAIWQNVGTRTISGPYEDEMSSEPWAGPAPTPVTPNDTAAFFKPFSGGPNSGPATGHLFQDNPATPGLKYTLSGWAGAEPNALMGDAVFAVEFLDAGGAVIGGNQLSLMPMLFVDNGQPFDYKQYVLSAVAPSGAAWVRARASMIDAIANPAGGGQAFVVDDFVLLVPEPSVLSLWILGAIGALALRRK